MKRYIPDRPLEDATFHKNESYKVHWLEIWALGITIVIGGQYFGWNPGLIAGFGSFLIATFLMGSAYICLICTASETTSALPFAGAFGLTRCALGFLPGFLVGCAESLEYIIYVATSCLSLCFMICSFSGLDVSWVPFLSLIFYLTALIIHICGGSVFWRFSNVMAFISLLIIVIYCLGGIRYCDFKANASSASVDDPSEEIWFIGGMSSFLKVFPLTAWWYVGVESLGFAYNSVEDVSRDISWGSISCIITLFVTSFFVLFVCSGISPASATALSLSPLDDGNTLIYGMTQYAGILAIPATYATAFGFMFAYGRMLESMAQSGLLPNVLTLVTEKTGAPYIALWAGSIFGYFVCLVAYYFPFIALQLFNVCMLFAFSTYICQCYCYWVVTTRFDSIGRPFKSPFGLAGAVYAAAVFFIGVISVIGFQNDYGFAVVAVIIFACVVTIYYYSSVVKSQKFSEDETNIMFKAYVINATYLKLLRSARKHRIKRGVTTFWDKVHVIGKATRKVFVDESSSNSSHNPRNSKNSKCSSVCENDSQPSAVLFTADDLTTNTNSINDEIAVLENDIVQDKVDDYNLKSVTEDV